MEFINAIQVSGRLLKFDKPRVMGILNLTPDSFYDGNKYVNDYMAQTEKMLEEGAAIIDIGAVSTRPGAEILDTETEWERLRRAIIALRKQFPDAIFSVDTFRAEIAKRAVSEGMNIINDISGGDFDKNMFQTIAQLQVPYVLMHTSATPKEMQKHTQYENVVVDVYRIFAEKLKKLECLGVKDVVIDPGFGFGKTIEQNFELIKSLSYFNNLRKAILVGVSRKSSIYKSLHTSVEEALNGTTVLNTMALMNGANVLRVHDVKQAVECVKLYEIYGKV